MELVVAGVVHNVSGHEEVGTKVVYCPCCIVVVDLWWYPELFVDGGLGVGDGN